jgi:hypothetical protein
MVDWYQGDMDRFKGGGSYAKQGALDFVPKGSYKRCYHSHKPLPLVDGLEIHGGSGNDPAIEDADVYIGFDGGSRRSSRQYPWKKTVEFHFKIVDMQAPADPAEFKKLVKWTITQLKAGKKVHAGCIGGHGRTGTFFAALVKEMLGIEDAIQYVRDNYCKKAVESKSQVDFLVKHYGVKPAKPAKTVSTSGSWGGKVTSIGGGGGRNASVAPLSNSPKSIWLDK